MRALFALLGLLLPITGWAKADYVGDYRIMASVIHFVIPAKLIGLPRYTQTSSGFQDERYPGIFNTSYGSGAEGTPAPGLALGLARPPKDLRWDNISTYETFYTALSKKRGLTVKLDLIVVEGRSWLRIEHFFADGNLARIIFATKLFDDMNLVLRIGLPSDIDGESRDPHSDQWNTEAEAVLSSIAVGRAK